MPKSILVRSVGQYRKRLKIPADFDEWKPTGGRESKGGKAGQREGERRCVVGDLAVREGCTQALKIFAHIMTYISIFSVSLSVGRFISYSVFFSLSHSFFIYVYK